MADHVWFHDHLAAYCADGLDTGQRQRFEEHAAACGSCRMALDEMRGFDGSLDRLFAAVRPAPGWESRVIGRLRLAPARRPFRVGAGMRWAGAAAAVVLFGLLGAALYTVMENTNGSPMRMFALGDTSVRNNLKQLALPLTKPPAPTQSANRLNQTGLALHDVDGETAWRDIADEDPAAAEFDADINFNMERRSDVSVPGVTRFSDDAGGLKGHGMGFGGGFTGFAGGIGGQVPPGNINGAMMDGTAVTVSADRLKALEDRFAEEAHDLKIGDRETPPASPKAPEATAPVVPSMGLPAVTFTPDGRTGASSKGRLAGNDMPAPPGKSSSSSGSEKAIRGFVDTDGSVSASPPPTFASPGAEAGAPREKNKASLGYYTFGLQSPDPAKMPPTPPASNAPAKEEPPSDKLSQDKDKDSDRKESDEANQSKKVSNANTIDNATSVAVAQAQKNDPPQAAQRKIIRTGEIEFEIESFDNAVAAINKLIGAIPGAFIATVNSEKLPNGKVRGSAVVRVPPEKLDPFVLDLRRDLAKSGDLKSQRIGSQDVTKQYTDIESRLRAARTMEERLLTIIKSGKGEIKDLIAAERELGTWRTKIEEMEGEIRYYNNQIGLSTLTITMYEKEIRAAAELVVSQQVTMRIETEDVESALQAALGAVTEAKGRVSKSDLKQQTAGQYEATLLFQVAPAAANTVRDKLRKLGIVTHQDTQRQQESVGGTSAAAEVKSRQNDVQFNVTLYNIANIQPRESYHLKIAVQDVTPDYRKLQEAVLRADGQVRAAQLSEQDRLNVSATFDFDVPTAQREAIDKLLAQLGDVLSRSTQRVAPSETATERKVGYRLTLHSVTSIPARETHTLQAVTFDVVDGYRKLREAVDQAKGHVRGGQLNEQDKLNITATFDFDVPADQREVIEKLLDEIGDVYSRNTARMAPNEIASDRKIGYKVTLRNAASMPPREKVTMKLEAPDVERVATTLKDMVKSVKGRVHDERIKYEENGQVVVLLAFDVPLSAKDELVRKFKGVGTLRFARPVQNPQVPDTELALATLDVMVTTPVPIVPGDEGMWPQIRTGLVYSFRLLSFSVMFIILGVSVVLPWALLIWAAVRIVRRLRPKAQAAA
jgi:hypothetical protein